MVLVVRSSAAVTHSASTALLQLDLHPWALPLLPCQLQPPAASHG